MQFTAENAANVMRGKKTQTRRPVRKGEVQFFMPNLVYDANGRVKWREGKRYTVQPGRGKKGIGYLHLQGISQQPVQSISERDAIAEGFASIAEFQQIWRKLYPKGEYAWENNPKVWVLDFDRLDI